MFPAAYIQKLPRDGTICRCALAFKCQQLPQLHDELITKPESWSVIGLDTRYTVVEENKSKDTLLRKHTAPNKRKKTTTRIFNANEEKENPSRQLVYIKEPFDRIV